MNTKEKELFFTLCDHINTDEEKLKELLSGNATPEVLGHLFFNRMQGVAYGIIRDSGLLSHVNREFRNSLKYAHIQNYEKNRFYFECLNMLSEILADQRGKYAMLKGALLCKQYPEGYRTSNDIDLLVSQNHVSDISEALSKAGFRQGSLRNGKFVPASRKEIIESKMMRGETVPYYLKVDLPYMEYLEVDINFSLDYKNESDNTVEKLISNSEEVEIADLRIMTLNRFDFLIHLCCHLYKEATTLPWVKMNRDMTLYKYCDIHMLMNSVTNEDCDNFFTRAAELETAEICACAIRWTDGLLGIRNRYITGSADHILLDKCDLLDTVISPAENKRYIYTKKNIKERFFEESREKILKEIK